MQTDIKIARRTLLKAMLTFSASAGLVACSKSSWFDRFTGLGAPGDPGTARVDGRPWARYAEKTDLIMLADRPPLLETPTQYLVRDITPNDAYFVRWHYAGLPTRVDLRSFRLNVTGAVAKPLQLSFNDLLTKFEPVSGVLFSACAGNSRNFFRPQVPGAQWTNGAMGNARYKGVRLKDVLTMAGVSTKAVEASFRGIEAPPLESSEMNGAPLPMLNGFPFRLVVPGWFATYWVKALSQITVRTEPLHNFWVDTAYWVPSTPDRSEDPSHPSQETTPLTSYPTRAVVISPDGSKKLRRDKTTIEGIAVGDGIGIRRVEVSTDGGQSWSDARLDPTIDKYSWRRWRIDWRPTQPGTYKLQCRATNDDGQTQPEHEWNHGGYGRHSVDTLIVEVV